MPAPLKTEFSAKLAQPPPVSECQPSRLDHSGTLFFHEPKLTANFKDHFSLINSVANDGSAVFSTNISNSQPRLDRYSANSFYFPGQVQPENTILFNRNDYKFENDESQNKRPPFSLHTSNSFTYNFAGGDAPLGPFEDMNFAVPDLRLNSALQKTPLPEPLYANDFMKTFQKVAPEPGLASDKRSRFTNSCTRFTS